MYQLVNVGQPEGAIPAANLIVNAISAIINRRLGISPEDSVRMANQQIDPQQRFYEVEYNNASIILSQRYPYVQQQAWRVLLQNSMGYRLVQIPTCRHGMEIDPVTRTCVPIYQPPEPTPEVTPPPEVPEKEEAGLSGATIALIAIAAFFLLRGR